MRGIRRRKGRLAVVLTLHWPYEFSFISSPFIVLRVFIHVAKSTCVTSGMPETTHLMDHSPEVVSTAQIILSACLSPGHDTKPKVLLRHCSGFALSVQVVLLHLHQNH